MTTRDVHLPVAAQPSLDDIVGQAVVAEAHGYDRAWLPETWGRDAVTTLSAIAERTESIGIGPSILNVYSRSPALIGQTAATLDELSDGRARIGVGPSGPAVIEAWHGASFDRPLRRTRECVEIVRQVVSGEPVDYEGDAFDVTGFRLRCDPPEIPPKIDAAGMGPKAVELAGRFADGWHALMLSPEGLADRLDDFHRGADLAGKDPADLRVTLSLTCCALDDGERARRLAREHLAFYVGAMGTYYRDSLARQGFETEANEIAARWGSGDQDGAVEAISDDLLDTFGAAGTPEHARAIVEEFESIDGVDAVAVSFPRGADGATITETIETLAP